jgi:NADP-dependent 3-hydroxy acid dehydrogenase YdfG
MPTIAIVGAGPGLGLSIARVFGSHGFDGALISRNESKLGALVAQLAVNGTTAAAYPADVTDRSSLTSALEQVAAHFGTVDVLEYSPYGGLVTVSPLEASVDNLQPEIEHHLYGAISAAQAVLPAMLKAGGGSLLFTTGGGAITPYPMLSTMNAAQAALRNWVLNLNGVLADKVSTPATSRSTYSLVPRPPKASHTPTQTTSPGSTGACTSTTTSPNTS